MENDAIILFNKLLNNTCSPEEAGRIIALLADSENSVLDDLILAQLASQQNVDVVSGKLSNELDLRLQNILTHTIQAASADKQPVHRKAKLIRLTRYVAAAMVLIAVSVGLIFFVKRLQAPDEQQAIHSMAAKLKPGSNKATLTLANGQQVILDSASNGRLANQHNVVINKTAAGKIAYLGVSGNYSGKAEYNTLSTPFGGTYSLTLADGTRVMLDAGSSIRYPVAFTGSERRVEVTGQAYFEVTHDKTKPFRVVSGTQTVEVLGTHFNINAYGDEGAMRTTLLEGKVKVSESGYTALLAPGQQAVVTTASETIKVNNTDVALAVAWKNDLFSFQRADLQTVMRQFARWYNVQVAYQGDIPKVAITGKVLRSANAGQILQILSNLGIHFKMEDRKIVIINN